jgi:hypothetical protein
MMNEARQKICSQIGQFGCYFLCIVHLAEEILKERIDVVELYEASTFTGVMGEDCFVNDPAKLIKMMVPGEWTMTRYGTGYVPKDGEYEITRYERTTTAGVLSHFVVTSTGNVLYDPLGDSMTVKYGKAVSKRVFRKII